MNDIIANEMKYLNIGTFVLVVILIMGLLVASGTISVVPLKIKMRSLKKRRIFWICLEVVGLAILLPLFCWGSFALLIDPLIDLIYYSDIGISMPMVMIVVLGFDAIWLLLMGLCCKGKTHIKLIITLFVWAFSAVILLCLVGAPAMKI